MKHNSKNTFGNFIAQIISLRKILSKLLFIDIFSCKILRFFLFMKMIVILQL